VALPVLRAHLRRARPGTHLRPRRHWLRGHLVLADEVSSPRILEVQVFSRHNVLHTFRLDGPGDVDAEFRGWLSASYDVGQQRHRA
jgi:hypothetical protein